MSACIFDYGKMQKRNKIRFQEKALNNATSGPESIY
jgi:hypothetical protein